MLYRIILLGLSCLAVGAAHANAIDFETFPDTTPIIDGTSITNQFLDPTFSNTTVISAGISLNEFEFPPHSGTNVAFDDGGPVSIDFDSLISSFSGYFTYTEPLTVAAFNASDTEIATASSAFSDNLGLSGDPGSSPNEFLQVTSAEGISSITIAADPAGTSFVMDDITFSAAVPEPGSWLLLLISGVGIHLTQVAPTGCGSTSKGLGAARRV